MDSVDWVEKRELPRRRKCLCQRMRAIQKSASG
jgi:hypothetical protein